SGGNLPSPPAGRAAKTGRTPWYRGDTLGLAIGQAQLTVTPLQIARMMAAVANDGYLVTPYVVREAGPMSVADANEPADSAGRRIPAPQSRRISGLSRETLRRVRHGLERVVSDRKGTGFKRVRLEQVAIAGKTGTA